MQSPVRASVQSRFLRAPSRTLQILATGIEGNQASQAITVTYTDNSTSQFTQSFSDWCSALNGGGCVSTGNNPGESVAVAMPYRDTTTGPDNRVFYLYHYSFALNTNKTVQSLTLPNNRNVVVLAVSLIRRRRAIRFRQDGQLRLGQSGQFRFCDSERGSRGRIHGYGYALLQHRASRHGNRSADLLASAARVR